jgi:hypothetical protein
MREATISAHLYSDIKKQSKKLFTSLAEIGIEIKNEGGGKNDE